MMITFLTDILERPMKTGYILYKRYKIISFIGKGSYGLTYRAFDLISAKIVLVKQLRKRKRKASKDLLEREAKMLAALDHPAIPKLMEQFDEDEKSFLVMEFIEGKNMEELIFHEGKKYNERESLQILLDLLFVIQYFHEKSIIHRDLRLPNILFKDHNVFVIDFGLAAFYGDNVSNLIEYMPLEKKLFREISYTSDFYALGHFILFLLYSAYQAPTRKEKSWEEELTLTKETKSIIRKLLKLDLSYNNANEIITDVKKVLIIMSDSESDNKRRKNIFG